MVPDIGPFPIALFVPPAPELVPLFPLAAFPAGVFSVKRPIFNMSAGGRPLSASPTFVNDAATTEGDVPGGTTIGMTSLTTGSNANDLEVSRCGTSRIRNVFGGEEVSRGGWSAMIAAVLELELGCAPDEEGREESR